MGHLDLEGRLRIRSAASTVSAFVAIFALWAAFARPGALGAGGEVGKAAPDFALRDLGGRTLRLSHHRGKAVFLNFWATWCIPCRIEMPSMEAIYKDYRGKGLEILAVSLDQGPVSEVEAFVKEYKLSFPILLDPGMEVAQKYRVLGLPSTYLIGRSGRIVGREVGGRDWTEPAHRKLIEDLLR